jgi:serine/threonine protein kinase
MASPIPSKIGKYDVLGVIGRGGMGVVYKATDPHLDRLVAIKMIIGAFAEHPDMLARFFREAQSLGSLQHPNIVTVFDLGDYDGNPYLVMEYLEGEGLDAAMSNHRQLNLIEKLGVVIHVCHGLSYAHARGVIHRDIKPANIMLNREGGVKIFDFGIAYAGKANLTRTGKVMGTLRYMAPEQFNSKSADFRTDIFSTGVVLYQLLSNHLPFEAENTASTILKIVQDPPLPLSTFLSAYPPEMEQILMRALAKNPDDRYSSADEFALDLQELQGRLKEELIRREMQEVALFLEQGDVYKAKSSLVRVLKFDKQHSAANRLLREVQQRIKQDEISKEVRELRQRAENAVAEQQYEQALEHLDLALGLDRNNTDLQQLRENMRTAAARYEKFRTTLEIAKTAQAEGKLNAAQEAVEAALAIAPDDTAARNLYHQISVQIEERPRQASEAALEETWPASENSLRHWVETRATVEDLAGLQALIQQRTRKHALESVEDAANQNQANGNLQEGPPTEPAEVSATRIFTKEPEQAAPDVTSQATTFANQDRPAAPPSSQQSLAAKHVQVETNLSEAGRGLPDERVFERADLRAASAGAAQPYIQPGVGSDALQEAWLPIIERQLASFIGPLAKVLVKRASAKATGTLGLYTILAGSLEERDRAAFLAKRSELSQYKAPIPLPSPELADSMLQVAKPADGSLPEITPAVIGQAARRLATHLGPIAMVLAKKDAKRATSLKNFYELLAEHVVDRAERERFLKGSGVR